MSAQPFPAPRTWLGHPQDFGHAANPVWKPARSKHAQMLLRGAQVQHQAVRRIRARLDAQAGPKRETIASIALTLKVHPDTIYKALSGRTHLSLTLADAIAHALGLVTTVQVTASASADPPQPVSPPTRSPASSQRRE